MRALPDILARNPKTHCILVGGDSVSYGLPPRGYRSWREAMLAEVGHKLPAERVHFVGNVPYATYVQLLQVSTCHAYLTYPFVLSWSCIEAMAAGCRIVASDTAPVREVLAHGENALFRDFFDVPGIAESVCNVLKAPTLYDRLARNARRKAGKYDLESVCKPRQLRWLGTLSRIVAKPSQQGRVAAVDTYGTGSFAAPIGLPPETHRACRDHGVGVAS
jgi:glycosyltransferase involved in cell wall biosynthesis